MSFLTPWFLIGLATLAVPVIIHMIQRERKDVVEFPSLMFVRKIPFRSFRRQRIRHWFLLLLRCAAVALLVAAFARPFFRAPALAAAAGGAREVVVLLDRSYSMGFGDRWERAKAETLGVLDDLRPEDSATVILFDSGVQSGPRATTDHVTLRNLVDDAELGEGTTRFGPALKLAEGVFDGSDRPRLEAVMVSDFQQLGVESATGVRFPAGTTLRPIPITDPETPNVSVAGVLFEREYFSGRERVAVSARVTNRGAAPVSDLSVTLDLDGREIETLVTTLPPQGSSTVTFAPVTLGDQPVAGGVRASRDRLPTDDVFYFVTSPGQVVSVLVVGSDRGAEEAALYLTRALAIGASPAFDVETTPIGELTAEDLVGRQVVVFNDAPPPRGEVAASLERFVREGGGLLVASGERSVWPPEESPLLPGIVGTPVDREGRGASLGFVDYSHPIFEVFSTPRSGDVTTARFFRYRPLEPSDTAAVIARFDDGTPALVEHRVGGRARPLLGLHAGQLLERPGVEARLSALRVSRDRASRELRDADPLVHRRAGAQPGRAATGARRRRSARGRPGGALPIRPTGFRSRRPPGRGSSPSKSRGSTRSETPRRRKGCRWRWPSTWISPRRICRLSTRRSWPAA